EPVVARLEGEARRRQDRFVSRAADLKENLALVFELDLLVVQLPRQQHHAVDGEQVVALQTLENLCVLAVQNRFHQCGNYSIGACWYMLDPYEQPDGSSPSVGRDRPRKSHRDAVAQSRHRRARDAGPDLLEARLPGADALARERADDLHPAGRAEVPDRRRGDYRPRGRGPAHPVVGGAPGGSARGHLRARSVQPDPPGLARAHRRLFPSVIVDIPSVRSFRMIVFRRVPIGVMALCAATSSVVWLSAQSAPPPSRIRGFSAASSAAEAARERDMKAAPSAKLAEADFDVMTAEPHHTGSPYEIKLADYVSGQFKQFGIEATKYEYGVLLPWPGRRRIDVVAPDTLKLEVEEEKIRGDQWADKPGILPAYNAYSPSGDVTGEIVYVNYGIPADYDTLKKLGIDVKGKIVLARYGGSWRGIKPKVASEHGAIACIIYSDPHEDGYFQGEVYPDGPFRS